MLRNSAQITAIACFFTFLLATHGHAAEPIWKAGVASVVITPDHPMWMSGYGSRDHESEGKLHDLYAKALMLEDPAGERVLLVTLDLVGIGRDLSLTIRRDIAAKHGLTLDRIALASSHTHTGPVVGNNLLAMYALTEAHQKLVRDYAQSLHAKVLAVVDQAAADVKPARLAWGSGQAAFAVNRRNNPEPKVPELRQRGQLVGPVDHDVPVLAVRDPDIHALRAIVFGYACHATVLAFYQWSGDYPGFAQLELQSRHPGATALFFAGCGADQNPLPRRSVELAEGYGKQLADAVDRVLDAPMQPVAGNVIARYREIDLPFDTLPTREQLLADAKSDNRYVAGRAKLLLEQLDRDGATPATYPYPVQYWRLGDGPRWVLLGGEVVVDYSLRLKREISPDLWVAGYANDVMAYIPSLRVLKEGGYEGGGAMVYYGLPTTWAESVEQVIVDAANQLSR